MSAPVSSETQPKQENFADVTLTKYKTAGEVAATALKTVIAAVSEGKTILELTQLGDKAVEQAISTVYSKDKKISKGSAFPTTISVNNVICNYAPPAISSDENLTAQTLKTGDVVKIQIGAHIDGLATINAETVVVGAHINNPVHGRAADAIKAANVAAEVAIRLMKPGNLNTDIAKQVENAIKQFDCRAVQAMQSNQFLQNDIDAKKKIVLNPEPTSKPETIKLENDEVYGVDISVTTSPDGKTKLDESKTTIYKKTNSTYMLKMATSRKVFSEIQKKAGAFPFNTSMLEDQRRARMGVLECANHGLLVPFHVLHDTQSTAITAQVFFTVAVNAKGAIRLTPPPSWYSTDIVKSQKQLTDKELIALLATPVRSSNKKNKKAAAKNDTLA